MKVLILDVYPKVPYRISKDQNGGYGTANDYGNGIVTNLLKRFVAMSVDWPPVYSMYCASVLREKAHDVEYRRSYPDRNDYDLIIVPSSIVAHETEIAAIIKMTQMGMPTVAIGPFATNFSQAYLKAGASVIAGEPEMYFACEDLDLDFIKKRPSLLQVEQTKSLDDLPYPAWDITFEELNTIHRFLAVSGPTIPIAATRGCPYSCSYYCTYPLQQGVKVRKRSPQKIVQEMIYWKEKLGVSNFIFRDPVFSIDRKHTLKLCEELSNANNEFKFAIETHLKNLDIEMVKKLRSVGLEMVYVGVESVDEDVMKNAKRATVSMDQQRKQIQILEESGIKVKGLYILGFPTDTIESCLATMNYAMSLNTMYSQFNVFTPYPGTPNYQEHIDLITTERLEDFTQYHFVFQHMNLTQDKIRKLLDMAYRKYYTNPRWILKHFGNLIVILVSVTISPILFKSTRILNWIRQVKRKRLI
jgi:anaerobic magnesium-protoporphyrin IX monomethyl ester cyclase